MRINKRGFIRTIESVIAIVILLGFILYIYDDGSSEIKTGIPENVEKANTYIINEFLHNETLRSCFVNNIGNGNCNSVLEINCKNKINDFLLKSVPIGYSSACEICKDSRSCTSFNFPKEKSVYPKTGFIYSNIYKEGRIVRIYIY